MPRPGHSGGDRNGTKDLICRSMWPFHPSPCTNALPLTFPQQRTMEKLPPSPGRWRQHPNKPGAVPYCYAQKPESCMHCFNWYSEDKEASRVLWKTRDHPRCALLLHCSPCPEREGGYVSLPMDSREDFGSKGVQLNAQFSFSVHFSELDEQPRTEGSL